MDSDVLVGKMLARMRDGHVKDVVTHDTLIKRLAALRIESLGNGEDQKINDMHRVSQCCRTLARLVIACKEKIPSSLINLDKLISPGYFDLVVTATKSMSIEKVSMGRFMGNLLGHLIQTKKGDALRKNDIERCQEAATFRNCLSPSGIIV
jgi:hypothetical protein